MHPIEVKMRGLIQSIKMTSGWQLVKLSTNAVDNLFLKEMEERWK